MFAAIKDVTGQPPDWQASASQAKEYQTQDEQDSTQKNKKLAEIGHGF